MALCALLLNACSAGPDRDAVAAAAQSFAADLAKGNGQAACALLTDNARSSATGATSVSCARAVLGVHVAGDQVSGEQVWGDAAQVRLGSDVLFLRLIADRWQVSAAGCTRQPAGPYDCKVGG